MEDRETPRMRKYGEVKTTRIMMATVPHVTAGSGLRKFQADGFLLHRVYIRTKFWRITYRESMLQILRFPSMPSMRTLSNGTLPVHIQPKRTISEPSQPYITC